MKLEYHHCGKAFLFYMLLLSGFLGTCFVIETYVLYSCDETVCGMSCAFKVVINKVIFFCSSKKKGKKKNLPQVELCEERRKRGDELRHPSLLKLPRELKES